MPRDVQMDVDAKFTGWGTDILKAKEALVLTIRARVGPGGAAVRGAILEFLGERELGVSGMASMGR